ncbi:hypothetical protein Slin15195_G129060 [Septoria linicola]|uniref:Uncharacterized protein n=1 Tax=Septoria linicola TaxID=215465 RepID=A0A9Q9B0R5_9PEZI|nr:hypothetical protein Slin14017_G121590 [Septoria linicola]USW59587.1 hypothetical protein Slin15195_G129060 [Septoria linicola]
MAQNWARSNVCRALRAKERDILELLVTRKDIASTEAPTAAKRLALSPFWGLDDRVQVYALVGPVGYSNRKFLDTVRKLESGYRNREAALKALWEARSARTQGAGGKAARADGRPRRGVLRRDKWQMHDATQALAAARKMREPASAQHDLDDTGGIDLSGEEERIEDEDNHQDTANMRVDEDERVEDADDDQDTRNVRMDEDEIEHEHEIEHEDEIEHNEDEHENEHDEVDQNGNGADQDGDEAESDEGMDEVERSIEQGRGGGGGGGGCYNGKWSKLAVVWYQRKISDNETIGDFDSSRASSTSLHKVPSSNALQEEDRREEPALLSPSSPSPSPPPHSAAPRPPSRNTVAMKRNADHDNDDLEAHVRTSQKRQRRSLSLQDGLRRVLTHWCTTLAASSDVVPLVLSAADIAADTRLPDHGQCYVLFELEQDTSKDMAIAHVAIDAETPWLVYTIQHTNAFSTAAAFTASGITATLQRLAHASASHTSSGNAAAYDDLDMTMISLTAVDASYARAAAIAVAALIASNTMMTCLDERCFIPALWSDALSVITPSRDDPRSDLSTLLRDPEAILNEVQ